jgi:flagellar motor switch protein FliG
MVNIIIGISFTLIWLATSFLIVRFVIKTKKDLLARLSEPQGETGKKEKKSESDENVQYKPLEFINRVNPLLLHNFIQNEHPQVIALILAHLEPNKASVILQNLYHETQSDVTRRIASMDRTSPEIIRGIERVLEKKISTLSSVSMYEVGGVEAAAKILNLTGNVSDQIIEALGDEDPELTEEIKAHMVDKL